MKKRLLALVLVLVMVLGLAACGKDKGDPNEIIIGDYTAYYTRSEFVTDYDGDDAIAIYFDFTNNSDENASFIWSMYYTVKQNDAELEQATVFLSEDSFDTLFDATLLDTLDILHHALGTLHISEFMFGLDNGQGVDVGRTLLDCWRVVFVSAHQVGVTQGATTFLYLYFLALGGDVKSRAIERNHHRQVVVDIATFRRNHHKGNQLL